MQESVLELRRRVLPEDHPDIGESGRFLPFGFVVFFCCHVSSALTCYDISFSYEYTGKLPYALEAAREALKIWKAALPSGHEDVTDAEKRVRDLEQAMKDDEDEGDDHDDDDNVNGDDDDDDGVDNDEDE